MNNKEAQTLELIDQLCQVLPEKQQYRSPFFYFIVWAISSVSLILIYLNLTLSIRFDLFIRLTDYGFLTEITFMVLGSCLFAYDALCKSIPGNNSKNHILGYLFTSIWMGLIAITMYKDIGAFASGNIYIRFDLYTFVHLVVAGAIPLAILWAMIHKLAPINYEKIALSASLAGFMLSAAMLRFFYVHLYNGADCSYSIFLWIVLPFVFSALSGYFIVSPLFKMVTPSRESIMKIEPVTSSNFILQKAGI